MENQFILKTCLVATLFVSSAMAFAQKIPNKQQASLYTPADLKIDGTAKEWNNKFQARNSAIEASYTIANNDTTLYLIIQTQHKDVVDKILRGGITFNINHTLDKKDEHQIAITYPILDVAAMSSITNMYAGKAYANANPDTKTLTIKELNKALELKSKTIKVKGIKEIPAEEISVYNQDGIKIASKFNDDLFFTYELAIPIKYLSLPNNGMESFSYQIKVNAPPVRTFSGGQPPPPVPISTLGTTDLWGEYKLVKK